MTSVLYQLLNDKYCEGFDKSLEYYQNTTKKLKKISEITLYYYPTKSNDELLNIIETLILDLELAIENYVYFISINDSHKFIMWLKDCKKILIHDDNNNNHDNDEFTIVKFSQKNLLIFINKIKLKFPTFIENNFNEFENIVINNNKIILELLNNFIINYNKFDDNFIIKREFDIYPPDKVKYSLNHTEGLYVNNILTDRNYKICYGFTKL